MFKKVALLIASCCFFTAVVFGDPPARSHIYSDHTTAPSPRPSKEATLSARTCLNSSGVYVSGDFIYWRARTEELFFVGKISSFSMDANNNFTVSVKEQEVDFKYDPGFKVGVGGNLPFDGWDLYLNWTHFHNNPSTSLSSSTPDLTPLFSNASGEGELPVGSQAKGSWDVKFNALDFDWGRLFYLSKTLYIRPSFGAKAVWIHQKLNFEVNNMVGQVTGNPLPNTDLKGSNKFWGVGPYFALSGVWNWGCGFGLYGQLSGAIFWGEFKQDLKILSVNTGGASISTIEGRSEADSHRIRPTVQALVGLDWRSCVYNDWLALNFQIGWEVQYFWSQLLNAFGGIEGSDFTLEGLTIMGRVDF